MKTALISLMLLLAATAVKAKPENNTQAKIDMKYGMQAVLMAAPGRGHELAAIMLQASIAVANLDGCIVYLVQQSLTDDTKVLITEVWDSEASHAASLTDKNVRKLIMKAKPIIIGMEHYPAKYLGGYGL